ncbi:8036_t:CDS:2 [Scutellospora calospora]|uniref:8036_t:CDS:1 n=1 Tax=Scutellospora calospora TaxID=85575 RepID=A0ACA9KFL2_9GLOM|nr:8036_t:CDS:2 [Scutellospora calospora]
MSTQENNKTQEVKSSIYRNRDGNYSNNPEDADNYLIFEEQESPESPNNSNNLSDSQRTITQSQVNSDTEMKNIYKTLFYWALFLIGLLLFAAWYFWHDRNFYITLIERENVNIERESVIIDTFTEGLKKLKREKIKI